jgi:hypothetical protein
MMSYLGAACLSTVELSACLFVSYNLRMYTNNITATHKNLSLTQLSKPRFLTQLI